MHRLEEYRDRLSKYIYAEWDEGVLFCGDCMDIMPNMPGECIDLVITSPPYNCRKQYDSFKDEMHWDSYYSWMWHVIHEIYRKLLPGGVLALNIPLFIRWQRDHAFNSSWSDHDTSYIGHRGSEKVTGKGRVEPVGIRLLEMMRQCDNHLREPIVWVKGTEENIISTTYQMGSDNNPYMRPCHEHILLGSKQQWHHRGGTGRRGREAVPFADYTKDVWFIQNNSDKGHPATFPTEIPYRLICLFTHADDAIVLDPFMGIGTTAVTAIKTGRCFVGCEISKEYCRLSEKRINQALAEREDDERQLVMFEGECHESNSDNDIGDTI